MKTKRKASKVIKEILNKIDKEIEEKAKRAYPDELRKHYFEETLDLFREAYVKGYKEGFKVGLNKIEDWFEENNEIISGGCGEFTTIKELEAEQCITNCDIVTQNIINNETEYDYVDLGLPSGTLWTTCNVGASKPEEYGDYFFWDDAQKLECILPSKKQIKELIKECTSEWTTKNGVNGRLFMGSNGKTMFLPAAGEYEDDRTLCDAGYEGNYLASTLKGEEPDYAPWLNFNSCVVNWYFGRRCWRRSVRAVKRKE